MSDPMMSILRRTVRCARQVWRQSNLHRYAAPTTLSVTQQLFVEWNAERLGISSTESRARYDRAWKMFPDGHRGPEYYSFNVQAHETLQVFFSDDPIEGLAAYRHHAPMHLLTMVGYPETIWADNDPIIQAVPKSGDLSILDFGCGLAEQSRSMATYFHEQARRVQLNFADITTLRSDFLLWLAARMPVSTNFFECSLDAPIPELPLCNVCFATEFFEHVHEPLVYFERLNSVLQPGGVLITHLANHHSEYMHVSPNLSPLLERVRSLGYEEIVQYKVYRKPAA